MPEFVVLADEIEIVKNWMIVKQDNKHEEPNEVTLHSEEERESYRPKPRPDAYQFRHRRTFITSKRTSNARCFTMHPKAHFTPKPMMNRQQRKA